VRARFTTIACSAVLAALFCTAPVAAQGYQAQAGQVEVSGFAGLLAASEGIGNHPLFGGGLFVHANKRLSIGGDLAYSPINKSTYGFGVTSNINYYSGLGKVRVHLPAASRVQPYVNGAFGAARASGAARFAGVPYFEDAETEMVYGGGAGFNSFVTRRFGVRFEGNYLRIHQGGHTAQIVVGAFYRFGGGR
jgi:hypothetical protein